MTRAAKESYSGLSRPTPDPAAATPDLATTAQWPGIHPWGTGRDLCPRYDESVKAKATVATALMLLAGVAALGAAEPADSPSCLGKEATIVGTDGNDVLHGTVGSDVIQAGRGNDIVLGERGNDVICGGPGTDLVRGGRNNDVVSGGPGDGDRAYGDLGDDRVNGGAGDGDEASGNLGIDLVSGGSGNGDYVHGDYGWDRMDGGKGTGDIAAFDTAPSPGVKVSLKTGKARGDGRDRLFRFEGIQGSPFDDTLVGDHRDNWINGGAGDDLILSGKGDDLALGGQGSDRCRGTRVRRSCGREAAPNGSAYVEIASLPSGSGGGLALVGGKGTDRISIGFDPEGATFEISAAKGISLGSGCARRSDDNRKAFCDPRGAARWMIADLGEGNDRLSVEGSLEPVGQIRISAGPGDDLVRGGPEDDLIESGPGSDRLYGGDGQDGLIGGRPGPTWLFGGRQGDLLAAGSGCAGGALVGGPGRDNASFAEIKPHPGRLIISLPRGKAWAAAVKGCDAVGLDRSNEDIEGSFGDDVLIGNRRNNSLLGQPGRDLFYGGGGNDTINALDRMKDRVIQCGHRKAPSGKTVLDRKDPNPVACSEKSFGRATPGLHAEHDRPAASPAGTQ